MQIDEFRYRASDGLVLYARVRAPDERPRGVVVLIHGLGEYGGRYEAIARQFVARGYVFVAGDLRGHGVSEGRRAFVSRLDVFMDDLDRYLLEVTSRYRSLPTFTYAFSMGSSLSAAWLIRRHPELNGAILCSGSYAMPEASRREINKARLLSLIAPALVIPNGMGPIRDKVCHDTGILDAYDADPLVYKKVTIGLAVVLAEAGDEALTNASLIRVPVLIMHGEGDVVALPEGSKRVAESISGDVTLTMWAGLYHFLHHEPGGEGERVISAAADWMDGHLSR